MKIWVVLPADYTNLKYVGHWHGGTFSTAATCPHKTIEMKQDGLEWFEVDVLRQMTDKNTSVARPNWY